jgi:hypothetical protein
MLGVGGNKKNLEQMRATERPSELEQMSTMKDLDKLLSDHLAPVQSEPLQS